MIEKINHIFEQTLSSETEKQCSFEQKGIITTKWCGDLTPSLQK